MTGKNWRFWTNSAIFSPLIISPVMIKRAIIFLSKVCKFGFPENVVCTNDVPGLPTQLKFLLISGIPLVTELVVC